ncbi:MAG: hypothetical protein JG762_965 [Deferribacteraceae bacterium]|jgi:exopolyphosphatase/guanosine-5'-triphosphate,3'-diphosphate pyrophosphatase|nr:hypothetical protein [Deferribacteraceae bacterium]
MKDGLFAVINIGASAFRMQISEFINGEHRLIEYLIKSLPIGKDTFTKGYISLDSVKKSVEILRNFRNKLNEYKVDKYIVISTSGLRDAKNKDFFMDYILINTGFVINILDPYEELFIRFTALMNESKNFQKYEKTGFIFANISSGNVAITINVNKSIVYAEALPFGSLRLNEIFRDIGETEKVTAFRNYVDNMLFEVKKIVKNRNLKHIFFTGSTVNVLNDILKHSNNEFTLSELSELLSNVEHLSNDEIAANYKIRFNEAEILKAVLVTYIKIFKVTGIEKSSFTPTSFPHKLLMYYSKSYKKRNLNKYLQNTLLYYGNKYNFDKNHALKVKENIKKIFNSLKEIHNISNSYLKILELVAVTHDFGYFINPSNHEYHSYHIIRAMHLPGVTESQIELIALIAMMHRYKDIESFKEYLPPNIDLFLLKKLVAMFRIADSLDASHKQKIINIDIKITSDKVQIVAHVKDYIYLEKLSFSKKSQLFENVYGVKIELKEKAIR